MKKLFLIINIIFFMFMKANLSLALTPEQQAILNQQQILQQQQEQQRQQEINRQQINEAERIRRTRGGIDGGSDDSNSLLNPDDLIGSGTDGAKCKVYFKKIKVRGNTIFSIKTLNKKILNRYIAKNIVDNNKEENQNGLPRAEALAMMNSLKESGIDKETINKKDKNNTNTNSKCINKKNIESLQNELMKFYIDRGYSNTRIYFDFNSNNMQDIRQGIFTIVVEEGLVNDIIMIDERYEKKIKNEEFRIKNSNLKQKEKKENNYQQKNNSVEVNSAGLGGAGVSGMGLSGMGLSGIGSPNPIPNANSNQHLIASGVGFGDPTPREDSSPLAPLPQGTMGSSGTSQEQINYKTEKKDNNSYKPIQESSYHKYRMKSQAFFAFPLLKGKAFNLKDYEQGLDQINRLQSNNATMSIKGVESLELRVESFNSNLKQENNTNNKENNSEPSTLNSKLSTLNSKNSQLESNVYIINQTSFPISLNLGIDNSGNKSTGENTANISLNMDNLISINCTSQLIR